jgi:hypothetical protein
VRRASTTPAAHNAAHAAVAQPPPLFSASPTRVVYDKFEVGVPTTVVLRLINTSPTARHVIVHQPASKQLRIKRSGGTEDSGVIAPGLCCTVEVTLTATTLANFADGLKIEPEGGEAFTVPIDAMRPRPTLGIADTVDCGACVFGHSLVRRVKCVNRGAPARFRFVPMSSAPLSNDDVAILDADSYWDSEQHGAGLSVGAFTVTPSVVSLATGAAVELTFSFDAARCSPGAAQEQLCLVVDDCTVRKVRKIRFATFAPARHP